MNASDGDVGAHIKLDGEGWGDMGVLNPDEHPIPGLGVRNQLFRQGNTESFSESTEPLCFDPTAEEDPGNDDEDSQTLAGFLELFDEREYVAAGST